MKLKLIFTILFITLNLQAGEGGSGGGPRNSMETSPFELAYISSAETNLAASGDGLTLHESAISDIRLRDERIISAAEFFTEPAFKHTFSYSAVEGTVEFKPAEMSSVVDIQLTDGQILLFSD